MAPTMQQPIPILSSTGQDDKFNACYSQDPPYQKQNQREQSRFPFAYEEEFEALGVTENADIRRDGIRLTSDNTAIFASIFGVMKERHAWGKVIYV